MKICQVLGSLSADETSDVYPTVPVCDECLAEYEDKEETIIGSVSDFNPHYGDSCYYCGKSKEEEDTEKGLI